MLTCELCGAKLFAEVSAKLPPHIGKIISERVRLKTSTRRRQNFESVGNIICIGIPLQEKISEELLRPPYFESHPSILTHF